MRRAAPAALVLLALLLSGCETTAEKSAKLERLVKRQVRTASQHALGRSSSKAHPSTRVRLLATSVLHSSEGDAVVLTLHNSSSTSLRDLPIEIAVSDARGARLYANDAPGLSTALVSAPLIRAHGTTVWIDDQIDAASTPAKVSAKIDEGSPVAGSAIPKLSVEGTHLSEGAVEGMLVNDSPATQRELVVNALARRHGKIVAAGRAIVAQAAGGGARTHFQLYLIGDPTGARLELNASPKLSALDGGA